MSEVKHTPLPCPFCGADPIEPRYEWECGRHDIFAVECEACQISIWSPTGFSGEAAKQAAIEAWNRRAPVNSHGDLVEALRRARGQFLTIADCSEEGASIAVANVAVDEIDTALSKVLELGEGL